MSTFLDPPESGGDIVITKFDTSLLTGAGLTILASYDFEVGNDLEDQGPNGYDWTATIVGSLYVVRDGKRGMWMRQAGRLDSVTGPGTTPLLAHTGDLTLLTLMFDDLLQLGGTPHLPGFGGVGETEATNLIYSIDRDSTGEDEIFWERGAGVNEVHTVEASAPTGRWATKALVKPADAQGNKYFINSELLSTWNSTPPTGGSSGELFLEEYQGVVGHVVVVDGLASDELIAELVASTGVY